MLTLAMVALLAAVGPGAGAAAVEHSLAHGQSNQPLSPVDFGIDDLSSGHAHAGSESGCAIASGHCIVAVVVPAVSHHVIYDGATTHRATLSHETREGIDLSRDPPPPRS